MICLWADRLSPPQIADIGHSSEQDSLLSNMCEPLDMDSPVKKKSYRQRAAAVAGVCETSIRPSNTTEAQLNDYLRMEVESEEEINPVTFWKKHSKQMPALSRLALYVLGVPATCAPVERVVSHGGLMSRPHQASMTDASLSQLIFLRCNRDS